MKSRTVAILVVAAIILNETNQINMKEVCLQCKGIMCVDYSKGRVLTEIKTMRYTEIEGQPVNKCPIRKDDETVGLGIPKNNEQH